MDREYLDAQRKLIGCVTSEYSRCPNKGANLELRQRLNKGGVIVAGFQCLDCGCWRGIKGAAVGAPLASLPKYDDNLDRVFAQQEAAKFKAQWDAEKEAKARDWWARYTAYLRTEKWRKKSAMVVARDVTCQACLARPATQAHHLTYEHVGDEPLFDLKGVCEPCHVKITKMDRTRRDRGVTPLDEVSK